MRRFSFGIFLLLGVLLLPSISYTQAPPSGPFAYVTNQSADTVSVIDTPTNSVVATIALPPPLSCTSECSTRQPAGLAVTPDGKFVYVANQGNGTVSVIDTSNNNTVSATIQMPCDCFPNSPVGVAITPDGKRAYVTNQGGAVHVIDISTNTVTKTIYLGNNPTAIAISGSTAYYTFGTNSVGRISTTTNAVIPPTITVGSNPTGVAVTPDGTLLYVTNNGDSTVSVVSTATLLPVPGSPVSVGSGPFSVAITPNGQFAYVVNQSAGTVSVINTTTQAVVPPPINVNGGDCAPLLNQIAITPDGTQAYVADASECDTADVISTASNTRTTSVPVGSSPYGVAIGPAAATTFTTPQQPVSPGTSTTFTDGNIISETIMIPGDANMGSPATAFKAVEFIQISPADFARTRLPGTPQNPNWSGGTTPIPAGTTCTVIAGTGGNCMVVRDLCFGANHVQITPCDIAAGPVDLIGLTYHYNSQLPQPNPGIIIADDNQNNWAVLPSVFNLDCCSGSGGTTKLNTDTTIVSVTPTTSFITSVIENLLAPNGCIDKDGIEDSLIKKLEAAQDAISRGQIQTAINILGAFKKHVQAQAGKHIEPSCVIGGVTFTPANVLLTDAQSLIDSLRTSDIADPITGYVMDANGMGLSGATVRMLSGGSTVATATTDITGFYFFATTGTLTPLSNYTVQVTGFPAGFTASTPSSQLFTWVGSGLTFNFSLH